ncbi:MAG: hypothetical protein LV481_04655, partial [Methylacidiphilales bacterium]|nr:hypothetical protein [Candidatus Methylacidiphilales bacterium]
FAGLIWTNSSHSSSPNRSVMTSEAIQESRGFEEGTGRCVPVVNFDYGALDAVESAQDDGRQVLRAAVALMLSPARVPVAAARLAQVFSLLNPGYRTVDILRLFHGLKRAELLEAKLELASLLSHPENGKAEAALTVPAYETDSTGHGGTDG